MASMAALQSSMASLSVESCGSSTIFGSSLQQARSQGQVTQNGPLTVRMAVKRWEKKKLQPNGLPVRQKIHVRVGDTVQVIAGRDKGKISEVTQVYSHNAKVLCKDVNVMTKHVKPRAEGESGQIIQPVDELWEAVRDEARQQSKEEPYLASFLFATIMAHKSLERALAFHVANKLADATLLSTQLFSLFADIFTTDADIKDAIRADIYAFKERDPACQGYAHGMLYFKGFLACQIHRAAHRLWKQGRTSLALALQNRVSEVFQVDIHPGATLGKGLLLDHATGVVIGETARVGDNVSILHHVTLGGTGASVGDRHPKIRDGVLIGAGATLLGPIIVGECAQIGASSLVLTDVPPFCTAVGVPARIIEPKGQVGKLDMPGQMMDHCTSIIEDYQI